MNCHSCQELLSDYLDGALSREDQTCISSHVAECAACACVHDELSSIVSCGAEYRDHLLETPPNPHALWLRISNIIESEVQPTAELAAAGAKRARTGWLSRTWRFTLPQLAATAAALVIGVSVLTTLGIRGLSPNAGAGQPSPPPSHAGKSADQVREQQIAYWDQRVQERRAKWSQQTRDAFDRNVKVLDQAVAEYRHELQMNPNDEVSSEMLDSTLNDKVAMLQDFAE
jgi:anti-sigma factor RsiW